MNPLDAMRIFARVAEMASFTRAAESLAIPKVTASTAVQQLEGSLGTRLLHRTTRKVQLTHDGQAYYERCKDLLADVDELQSMFQQGSSALRGRLRVDMPTIMARNVVIRRLPEFMAAHPLVEVELSCTDRFVDLVREGFDCVVRVGAVADSPLVARPLGRYRMANCASAQYIRRHGMPRTLDDLAGHRLIHYAPSLGGRSPGWEYPTAAGYASLPMPGALTVNNTEAYLAACLAGLGLIQSPAHGLRPWIDRGELVEVLPDYPAEPMPVTLLYAHRRHLPKRVREFMCWLAEVLAPTLDDGAPPGAADGADGFGREPVG